MYTSVMIYDKVIYIEVTHFYPGCEAKTNCCNDDAYPAEAPEIEWQLDSAEHKNEAEFLEQVIYTYDDIAEQIEEALLEELTN